PLIRAGAILQAFEFFPQRIHTPFGCSRQRYAARVRIAQRLNDVQPCRYADIRIAALLVTEGLRVLELLLDQVREREILEHEIEELLAGKLEGEIVHPFAGVACLA